MKVEAGVKMAAGDEVDGFVERGEGNMLGLVQTYDGADSHCFCASWEEKLIADCVLRKMSWRVVSR